MSGWAQLRDDLAASARVWFSHPALPLLTLALHLVVGLAGGRGVAIILFPVELFLAGFVGTQRIWYLRAFRGDQFDSSEIWPLSWAFFLRYASLAIVTFVLFIPVLVVAHVAHGAARILVIAMGAVALDVALTFVTPALAYSTAGLGEAWRIGRSMIKDGWPVTAWYALAPPLAVQAVLRSLPRSALGTIGLVVAAGLASLVTLLCKGAVAAYYLRQVPAVGRDGAAYAARTT